LLKELNKMDLEKEIEEIKEVVNVLHNELFQANKLPARIYSLQKRIEVLESKLNL